MSRVIVTEEVRLPLASEAAIALLASECEADHKAGRAVQVDAAEWAGLKPATTLTLAQRFLAATPTTAQTEEQAAQLQELLRLRTRVPQLENQLSSSRQQHRLNLAQSKAKVAAAEVKLADCEVRLASAEAKLTETEGRLAATSEKLASTKRKLAHAEDDLDDLEYDRRRRR